MNFFQQLLAAIFGNTAATAATKKPTLAPAPAPTPTPTTIEGLVKKAAADGRITAPEVYQISAMMIAQHSELQGANALMAGAMAMTESGGNTLYINPNATRFEPAFLATYIKGKAAELYGRTKGFTASQLATSYGVGQVMLQTAIELYNRGYRAYGFPSPYNLKKIDVGIYFMLANQADIIKRSNRSDEYHVVQSYNGGIGTVNTRTQNHLTKYLANKSTLQKVLG